MADVTPTVRAALHRGPIPDRPTAPEGAAAGAVVAFLGVVRAHEHDRPLRALRYEAYEPMTTRELRNLAAETAREFALLGIAVEHSVGPVAPGETSFRLRTAAAHRRAAIDAADAFIERMKRDVPLWKVPVFADRDAPPPGQPHEHHPVPAPAP